VADGEHAALLVDVGCASLPRRPAEAEAAPVVTEREPEPNWGDPIDSPRLQWSTEAVPEGPALALPTVEPPPGADRGDDLVLANPAGAPFLPGRLGGRRIRYRLGAWRRLRSLVELLILAAVLVAVLATALSAAVAGISAVLHHAAR
jgi:hypothetical protein